MTLKMKDQEEGYVWKSFLRSFRQNFRQSTAIWLLPAGPGRPALGGLSDFLGYGRNGGTGVLILAGAGGLVWFMVFLYVFPFRPRFYNTIGGTLRTLCCWPWGIFPGLWL